MNQILARVHDGLLVYQQDRATIEVAVGTIDWYRWLETASVFSFSSQKGSFTARCEQPGNKRGGRYWKAYRKRGGKLASVYLGKTERLTLDRLNAAAMLLAGGNNNRRPQRESHHASKQVETLQDQQRHIQQEDLARRELSLADQLLATKFFVPVSPHVLIPRSRLSNLLYASMSRKLTLVSAPAGFGKTTMLSAWVRSLPSSNPQVAWVSLDEGDNYTIRFWEYVLTALDKSEPGAGTYALSLLHVPQGPCLEYMLTTLINALAETSNAHVLILDDYHLITEQVIHTSLSYLLEHLPSQLHLILLTRADPPLPLSRLRAQGQVLEVRTDQLRMTDEEVNAFLHEVMRIELAPETLAVVTACTEGWLVGLQLVGLSLQGIADPSSLLEDTSGSSRYILDYLAEEVLRRQPAAIQTFLLRTSILEQLTAPLCDAVLEQTGSQKLLESLERANLFIAPLDNKRRWYRYHTLFAEALRDLLGQADREVMLSLHLRASRWYEQQEQRDEAVLHALLAQEWQRAADLIEPFTGERAWRKREVPQVLHWLEQLPMEIVRTRPRLCLVYARLLRLAAQPKAVESWLKSAEVALTASPLSCSLHSAQGGEVANRSFPEGHEHERMLGEIAARRALVASHYGDGKAAEDMCQQALAYLAEQDSYEQALVAYAQSMAALTDGNAETAFRRALEASALFESAGHIGGAISFMSKAGSLLHMRGQLHEAWQIFQHAIKLGTDSGELASASVGAAYTFQADILREWNQLDTALDLALQGIQFLIQTGYTLDVAEGNMVLVRIRLARGELDAANEVLQQLAQSPLCVDNPYQRAWMTSIDQARLWIARGELEHAARWSEALENSERTASPFAREREDVALARILLAQARPAEALKRLEPLLVNAQMAGRWDHVIEMKLLQALAYQQRHDEKEALTTLAQAVRLAQPEGYIRRFVDEDPSIATLLSRLREREQRRGPTFYLDSVLAAFTQQGRTCKDHSSQGASHMPQQPPLDPLSKRELEVLHLVARGASNLAIAQELVLSVDTVKRHVGNILGKLGAANRTQAVAQARFLGLLAKESELSSSRKPSG